MNEKKLFFPNLDGLRFMAFMMVFVWHALRTPFDMLQLDPWLHNFFYLFLNGKTGVSIFFVLSGFLITYLILAEIQLSGKLNIGLFYMRRTLRIWPLYFLILFLIFVPVPWLVGLFGFNWMVLDVQPAWYFLFIGNFDVLRVYLAGGTDLLASTVTWSVAIEEQFYLVWPLLFVLLPQRAYKFIFPVVLVTSYYFRWLHADSIPVLTFHSLSVCGDLALGGWVAYLSFTNSRFVGFFARQTNRLRVGIYLSGSLLIYGLQFAEGAYVHAFERLPQTILFAYIILDQNFSEQQFMKFSNNKFASYWGKYTYGLYLWHAMVLLAAGLFVTKILHLNTSNIITHLLTATLSFIASLVVSYYSYQYFEKYFLQLKQKFAVVKT